MAIREPVATLVSKFVRLIKFIVYASVGGDLEARSVCVYDVCNSYLSETATVYKLDTGECNAGTTRQCRRLAVGLSMPFCSTAAFEAWQGVAEHWPAHVLNALMVFSFWTS